MFNYDPEHPPICNVVIEKEGEVEKVCGQVATQLVSLSDPDDLTRILAVVLLCDKHDKDFDEGKSLIAAGENGERIAIGYKNKGE